MRLLVPSSKVAKFCSSGAFVGNALQASHASRGQEIRVRSKSGAWTCTTHAEMGIDMGIIRRSGFYGSENACLATCLVDEEKAVPCPVKSSEDGSCHRWESQSTITLNSHTRHQPNAWLWTKFLLCYVTPSSLPFIPLVYICACRLGPSAVRH